MGRGDRPPDSRAHRRDTVGARPRYEVVLAAEAEDELVERVRYIHKDSPKNATEMLRAIFKRRDALASNPRIGHVDQDAPLVPKDAAALVTIVKKIGIYYLFPMRRGDREIVYVVSIRRGSRMPLAHADYARRWLEEVSKLPSPAHGEEQD